MCSCKVHVVPRLFQVQTNMVIAKWWPWTLTVSTVWYRGSSQRAHLHPYNAYSLPLQRKAELFPPRHRLPQWLQMTRLYSFHCEPIIAVMLISLFNYSTGSHGRAVIKRKASKTNGVRVAQLNTVLSAIWKIENTCTFWENISGIHSLSERTFFNKNRFRFTFNWRTQVMLTEK